MKENKDVINNPKSFIKRLFCKHEPQYYRKQSLYYNLSGETQYRICSKCGKRIGSRFVRNYDGS